MQLPPTSFSVSSGAVTIHSAPVIKTPSLSKGQSLFRSVTYENLSVKTSTANSEELIPEHLRLTPRDKFELEFKFQKIDADCINVIFSKAYNYPGNIPDLLQQRIKNISYLITTFKIVNEISVDSMRWIFENFNLQTLQCSFSTITNAHLQKCCTLQTLICNDVQWQADTCLENLKIQHIAFSRCSYVTDHTIENITYMPEIKKIELIAQPFISEKGFNLLSNVASLTTLRIEGCTYFSDQSLEDLDSGINTLKDLTIVNCPNISWKGLTAFCPLTNASIIHLTEYLEEGEQALHIVAQWTETFSFSLRIVNCKQITAGTNFFNEAVRQLSNICKYVRHLVIRNSAHASLGMFMYLRPIKNNSWIHPHLVCLEKITVNNCKNITAEAIRKGLSDIMISVDLNSSSMDLYFMPDKRIFNDTWPLLAKKLEVKIDPKFNVVLEPIKVTGNDTAMSFSSTEELP